MELKKGDVLLFQGDSITDKGRNREDATDLASGYVLMAAARLMAAFPEKELTVLNRGIGGDRAVNLEARWRQDCLDIKPDILSIMIGVNDMWRRFDQNDPTTATAFYDTVHRLLDQVMTNGCRQLVLCEPFLIPAFEQQEKWRADLDEKIDKVRRLAREYQAVYVPFDGLFAQACSKQKPTYWAQDGVHPTVAGHSLMASAWLSACGFSGV